MDFFPLPTGMVVLIGIAVVASALIHWRIRRFWLASILSSIVTPLLFLIASTLQSGMPDPLQFRAFMLFGAFAFVVAVIVGAILLVARRPRPVGA